MIYGKLILRNAKRSVKDYLIYIVTLTLCVTMFYSFLSISSSYYHPDIGSQYELNMLSDGMKGAICGVTLLLLFLIKYVNNYMIGRKQKEFAIQTVMGMERKTTAALFFAETMLMGFAALGLGIVLGTFCSQFITAMLLSAYGQPFQLTWTLYPDTVFLTVLFFTLSYAFIGLLNVRTIQKIKVIDMLYADKTNEPDFKKSKWMPVIALLFGILSVIMLMSGISYKRHYFDARLPFPVHLMFWSNILLPGLCLAGLTLWILLRRKLKFSKLVIFLSVMALAFLISSASVPVMRMKYFLTLPAEANNTYMLFLLASLIFIVCSIFYLTSGVITAWKEKSNYHKYKEENLFFFGQILSKLKTTTKTMTLICLTLALSIGMFLMEPALSGWVSGYLESRSAFDVQISSTYRRAYDVKELPDTDYGFVTAYLAEHEIQIEDECTFSMYLPKAEEFHQRVKWEFPILAISLSDYNHLLIMRGIAPIELKDYQFALQWRSLSSEDERNEVVESHSVLETDAGHLTIDSEQSYEAPLGEAIYNAYTDVIYVFPDTVCEQLMAVDRIRFINTAEPIPYDAAIGLQKEFEQQFPEQIDEGISFSLRTRTEQVNSTTAGNFILQASMTYGAIVLLIICFTILALQQLLDATHYPYRFGVLRKLGVEETHINRLVLKQLGVWFGLPISVAVIVASVFGGYFFNTISSQISAYIGIKALTLQIVSIAAILLLLLACYFISTRILFNRAIRKEG
nr:ABC transporter permease [Anaerocolumna cellulosilytica]